MKKLLIPIIFFLTFMSCEKNEVGNLKYSKTVAGTYLGEKTINYLRTHNKSVDTITIKFDSSTYSYTASDALDFGRGNFLINNNSIEFKDYQFRNALYSWEWILTGSHKFRFNGDSLVMNQNGSYIQVSCRLKKITK